MNKQGKLRYYLPYIILFFLASAVLLGVLLLSGKTLVRNGDSLTQHYPAFLYISRYWRTAARDLLSLKVPATWDFSVGFGADIVQTLTYYGLTDWSTVIFAVFSNASNGALLYTAMMVFRTFLTGLAFLGFCRRFGCPAPVSALACIAYLFCPFMLEGVFNGHHFFGLPLLYLPVILLFVDKCLKNETRCSLLFPLVIFFAALSSFYFFFMEMVCAVVFFIFRYFGLYSHSERSVLHFLRLALRTALVILAGILLAAPVLAPQLAALFSDGRMKAEKLFAWFYQRDQYKLAVSNLLSSESFSYYSYVGISSCILIGAILLPFRKKQRWLLCMLLAVGVSLLLPLAGKVMNGFSYVANRHVWIWSFLLCFSFAVTSGETDCLSGRQKAFLAGIVVLYLLLVCLLGAMSSVEILLESVFLLLGTAAVALASGKIKPVFLWSFLGILVCLGTSVHIRSVFVERDGFSSFLSVAEIAQYYDQQHNAAFDIVELKAGEPDAGVFRLDWNDGGRKPNSVDTQRKAGNTHSYWSFQNSSLIRYLDASGVLELPQEINGLDNRYYLRTLLGCKYIVDPVFDGRPGYRPVMGSGQSDAVYENVLSPSVVRLYRDTVSEQEYYASSFGRRQVAESLACVIPGSEGSSHIEDLCAGRVTELDYEAITESNLFQDGIIEISDPGEAVTFLVDCPAEGELYLGIYNLSCENEKAGRNTVLWVGSDNVWKSAYHYSPYDIYFSGKRDYLFNLEYSANERKEIALFFDQPGQYSFDRIVIEYVPFAPLADAFADRTGEESDAELRAVAVSGGTLSVKTDLKEPRILYCAVPFSDGWSVKVDGAKGKLFNANILGIGIRLSAGSHEVVFEYSTPLLKAGLLIAILGLLLYAALIIFEKRNRGSVPGIPERRKKQ